MKPSEEFTIHILDDKDFNVLPYDKANEALGMTIVKEKTAYIRKTGVKELDMSTINHEFDELMQQTSPHEINGVRYKLPFIGPLISWIASMGAPAAGLGGAAGPATLGSAFASGLGSIAAPIAGAAATSAAISGGKNLIATGNVFGKTKQPQQTALPGFQPTGTTSAFAPQTQQPLGRTEFDKSLSNLTRNADAQQKSVFERFRGLGGTEGNTAFSGALSSARSSSDLARKQFLQDQKKLGSTFT